MSLTRVMGVDLAASWLDILLGSISGLQLLRTGKAKLFAMTTPQRLGNYPVIPTVAESGLTSYGLANTYSLFAQAKTPPVLIAALNREVVHVLADPDLRKKMMADTSTPAPPRHPDELKRIQLAEIDRWEAVVKKAGIQLQD